VTAAPDQQAGGGKPGPILAFDTATTVAVIALGRADGTLLVEDQWIAGYRHGEELLVRIDRLLARAAVGQSGLGAIVVGTGPGAFTGLRVGLATAKGLAHGLAIPLVGIPTRLALLEAARTDGARTDEIAILMPAGPTDRILIDPRGEASLVPGGLEPELDATWTAVAVDLPGRASADAVARGDLARARLGTALLAFGAERLERGQPSDLATLVPEYVTLPRGVREESGAMAWSRDPS
jgi:tRNA A37 threonylcarbamoyladenosine modification protein TsaB